MCTMKRNLLLIVAVILIVTGLFLLVLTFRTLMPKKTGALQVQANIKSTVYLDDKIIGTTTLCLCDPDKYIPVGEYTIKIVPEDTQFSPFVVKTKVEPNVLTVVERTFLPGSQASAYTLTLEEIDSKDAQIFVGTLPDSAIITIDSIPRGASPYLLDSISVSEHEIEIEKEGFSKQTIRVNAVEGRKLTVYAYLGTQGEEIASDLEKVSPTPTTTSSSAPEQKSTSANTITINSTPVGFLRVRSTPSTSGEEVGRVDPGEEYEYSQTQNGWYKITLSDETEGWVSGTYVSEN